MFEKRPRPKDETELQKAIRKGRPIFVAPDIYAPDPLPVNRDLVEHEADVQIEEPSSKLSRIVSHILYGMNGRPKNSGEDTTPN